MSSAQKCADRLREQAYETLAPQIKALEDELQDFNKLFADKILGIGYRLEALRRAELPATESILGEYLRDDMRKRDIEGDMLVNFTRGLRTKETQAEILASLLDCAANCFPRAALFAVRGDMFKGWSSRGFSDSAAEAISSDEFRRADCPWLLEAFKSGTWTEIAALPDTGSLRYMREESSGGWRIYPLYVIGRPVAVLLAGEAEGFAGRPKVLSALMDCAALRLENVALKIIKTPGKSAPAASAGAATVEAKPLFDAYSAPQPPAEPPIVVLNLNLTSPVEIPAPAEFIVDSYYEPDVSRPNPLAELKLAEPPIVVLDLNLTSPVEIPAPAEYIVDSHYEPDDSRPNPLAELKLAEPPIVVLDLNLASPVEIPTLAEFIVDSHYEPDVLLPNPLAELKLAEPPPEPSVGIQAVEATAETARPAAQTDACFATLRLMSNSETEKLDMAARRFAELLVSEIRQYNENTVAEGRKNRDLYKRLQRNMDRSREMYERRVSPTIASRVDYLHEEFVRVLADGDAEAFGEGYPGPICRGVNGTL